MNKIAISIFVPVYNEIDFIFRNIEFLCNYLKKNKNLEKLNSTYEIIIVDDNSNDGTFNEIKKLEQKYKYIKGLHYKSGPSRRENLAHSLREAKYDYILFMDSDLATDINALPRLIDELKTYPIVIGSRYMKNSKIRRKLSRKIISYFYNGLIRVLFNSKILDHQCGFKGFHKKTLLNLVEEMGYDNTLKRGWFWDAELLIRAQKKGINIKEIPVIWKFGEKSSFSIRREIRVIDYMLRLFFKLKKLGSSLS